MDYLAAAIVPTMKLDRKPGIPNLVAVFFFEKKTTKMTIWTITDRGYCCSTQSVTRTMCICRLYMYIVPHTCIILSIFFFCFNYRGIWGFLQRRYLSYGNFFSELLTSSSISLYEMNQWVYRIMKKNMTKSICTESVVNFSLRDTHPCLL